MAEESGICTIIPRDQEGFRPRVFGMGILLDNREIVTCAHVIDAALGRAWTTSGPGVVRVCFPFVEGEPWLEGTVDKTRWFPRGETKRGDPSDVAFIQLAADAPTAAGRAVMKKHVKGQEAETYGFRGAEVDGKFVSHNTGEWVAGKIMRSLPGGRGQFDADGEKGMRVEKGYSGAGLFVETAAAVVGMIVEVDRDKERKVAQFVDVPSLLRVRGRPAAAASVVARHAAPPTMVAQTQKKKAEIEVYLREVGAALPEPNADAGLLPHLEPVLKNDDETARALRAAFGFPKDAKLSAALYDIVASGEPSASPFLGILAQRLNHLLWRFESTLKYIPADWAEQYKARSEALRELCDPHLVAKRPTLRDVSAALRQESKELRAFTESAPDPTLYAVLRSFDEGDSSLPPGDGGGSQDDREVALDFLSKHVSQLLGGGRVVDDSSNAWWAVRTGLCSGDERFRDLLKGVAHKYYDITVPAEHVSKLGAVPEIYKPIRTSSYTLSNAQAIVERERNLDASLKEQLRQVIYRMLERLLKTPPSKQLYLASVHHEGLSNYLDYVADQEREAAGTNPDSPARCDAEGAPAEEVEK